MKGGGRIYLDFNATTPCESEVVKAMVPFFTAHSGNPASRHWSGRDADDAVASARGQVAALIHAAPSEIVWTSGATEANNLALKGVAFASQHHGRHIITQATEHKAVLDPVERLRREGFEVTILPVDEVGRVSPQQVAAAVRTDTILVTIMWANNETGTVQDIASLVAAAKDSNPNVVFHSDATQAVGKLLEVGAGAGADLMSFSAHKLYGPKGCGALYVRRTRPSIKIEPQIDGGGHERGFRSGTLNVAGIVGFGEACKIALAQSSADFDRSKRLRAQLWTLLTEQLEATRLNGCPHSYLPNTLNVSFDGASAESVLMACDDIAMSSGSACTSASIEPSHVLRAMGVSEDRCFNSIRISIGRTTTEEEIHYVAESLIKAVQAIRALAAA
jgi:cysteine desulfurase